jgi:hypothetical protein
MRTAGIIRIVIGLVIAVLLTAILLAGLFGQGLFQRLGWNASGIRGWLFNDMPVISSSGINSESGESTVTDTASVSAADVREIKIDWVAGSIDIRVGTGDDVVFYETANRTLTDAQKMRYSLSTSGVLQISFREDIENIFNWFSVDSSMPSKALVIEVPAALAGQLDELDIDNVSSRIEINSVYGDKTQINSVSGAITCVDVTCDELTLSSTSGSITCENCTADKLRLNNVSGTMHAEGNFTDVQIETVSGNATVESSTAPEEIDGDSVSGKITLILPEGAGFTAKLDSVSGSLSCEFPGTLSDKKIVSGDGSGDYSFNSVSGGISIEMS